MKVILRDQAHSQCLFGWHAPALEAPAYTNIHAWNE